MIGSTFLRRERIQSHDNWSNCQKQLRPQKRSLISNKRPMDRYRTVAKYIWVDTLSVLSFLINPLTLCVIFRLLSNKSFCVWLFHRFVILPNMIKLARQISSIFLIYFDEIIGSLGN